MRVLVGAVAALAVFGCLIVTLNYAALTNTRRVERSASARQKVSRQSDPDSTDSYSPPPVWLPERDAIAALGERTVSCPLFSGPGYNKERHPSREITVPKFEAPFAATPHPPALVLDTMAPSDVTLARDTVFDRAFRTNLRYLLMVDTDALLLSWRLNAPGGGKWPKGAFRLMGWEHTGSELRGHFLGHWLSAAAISYAATGDARLGRRMRQVVGVLAECAAAHGNGYLSAFPESFLARLEDISPVWAPYYTLHKLLAGLLQQHTLDSSDEALRLATGLATYIQKRVDSLKARKSLHYHFETLNQECGGINEGLWTLAAITRSPSHRALASHFDKPCLLGPLAQGGDQLTGMHGNTALALLLGAQRRFEVTGEAHFHGLSAHFFGLVDGTRTFATGGSTNNELWGEPAKLGHTVAAGAGGLGYEHAESCTTHNMMRLAGKLLRASGGALRYADFLERALLNGVMGTQRGEEPGAMLYFMPLGVRVSKAAPQSWRHAGWSTPFGDFWCCMGTGVEAFARLGEFIFLQSAAAPAAAAVADPPIPADVASPAEGLADAPVAASEPALYVLQMISSSVRWTRAGLRLRLDATPPGAAHPSLPAAMRLTVRYSARADGSAAALLLRVPSWAVSPTASVNGMPVGAAAVRSGAYLRVRRVWREGDQIEVTAPLNVTTTRLTDDRPRYAHMHALHFGPLVLACIDCASQTLRVSPPALAAMVSPVPASAYEQLRTFLRPSARGAEAGAIVLWDGALWVREGPLPAPAFRHSRRGADDVAIAATFRLIPGLADGQNLVSFEPVARPGCYVAPPADAAGAPSSTRGGASSTNSSAQLRLLCLPAGREPSRQEAAAASYRRHDPLVPAAHGSFQSYESLAHPGRFLSTTGASPQPPDPARRGPSAAARRAIGTLRPLALVPKPKTPPPKPYAPPSAYALESCFEEAVSAAEYPAAAWWLLPPPPAAAALLYALSETVDETYSVYWDLSPHAAAGARQ